MSVFRISIRLQSPSVSVLPLNSIMIQCGRSNFEKNYFSDMKYRSFQCKTVPTNKIILKFKVMNVLTIRTMTVIVQVNSQSVHLMTIRCWWSKLITKWFTANIRPENQGVVVLFLHLNPRINKVLESTAYTSPPTPWNLFWKSPT